MSLRIIEREARKKLILEQLYESELREQARSYPTHEHLSEEAFLYKVKALRSQYQDRHEISQLAESICKSLKDVPEMHKLSGSKSELSLVLQLI